MSIEYRPYRAEERDGRPISTWYFAYWSDLKYDDVGKLQVADRPLVGMDGYASHDIPRWWKCV